MKASYKITEQCCSRPAIAVMDYQKATPSDAGPFEFSPRVNRCCTRCWAHWFGPVDAVKRYTRAEWDRWLEAA